MELTVLIDNNTFIDRYFYGEPGVSYFIKDEDKTILFDVGYSDAFIKNAQKMDIDLRNVDFVVLSHGHLDHTWGLVPLIRLYTEAILENIPHKKPIIIAHPFTFLTKTVGNLKEIGSIISKDKLSRHFPLKLSKDSIWLTEKLVFLGQIDRIFDFETESSIGTILKPQHPEDDYLVDDTALAYKSKRGLVVITSCSHSGICNIVEYAKKICKDDKVVDIIGGFHLLNPEEKQLNGTLEYMKKLKLTALHACHCTDLNSKIALSKVANLKEVGVGLSLKYD